MSQSPAQMLQPAEYTQHTAANDACPKLPMYLMNRDGVYTFKRKIPEAVARLLNRSSRQVWKSLRTSDPQIAGERLEGEVLAFDAMVASAKNGSISKGQVMVMKAPRGKGTTKYLLPAHIPFLLARYEFGMLSRDDDERRGLSREDRAERSQRLEEGLAGLYDAAATDDFTVMEEVARLLLEVERLIAPPGTQVRRIRPANSP